jgi:hypothetical protein
MDEWFGQANRLTDGPINRYIPTDTIADGQTERWTNQLTDRHTGGQTNLKTGRQTDIQAGTHKRTDGQAHRRTDRPTESILAH